MAKIELNIVALGDFSSVNSQIKALQAQVELLNNSVGNVSLSSNLSKSLSNIANDFTNAMTASGKFKLSTVQTTTELENFGASLQKGNLGLKNYFQILTNQNTSATQSVKALALEQTKLQNSIVMADPTKQGFYSVLTPTKIDEVANATKIAANEQNIYNIAVNKGSQALINWGKNTQWAGRQLTVGMSMPLILFGSQAVSAFDSVNTAITQLQKVYGEGLTPPSQNSINQISQQVLALGKNMASTLGITQEFTVQVATSFAAMGKMGTDLTTMTEQTDRLAKLGNLDQQTATNAVIALQNVYKLSTTGLADAVNYFGAVQKQTSLSMTDLVQAESKVGPIIDQLGGTYKDTATMVLAMKEAGVPAAQAANALKSAFASIIAPTSAANKEFASFGINLANIKNAGGPVQMIEALQSALAPLQKMQQEQLIEKLFGKYQFSRISALIANFNQGQSQTVNAIKVANASSAQLAGLANQELNQATSSPSAQWQKAMATLKADLYPVGQKIIEIGTAVLRFGNGVSKLFSGLPGPVKTVMGALAIGVTLSGPIIMLTGLLGNFVGYLVKGIFNLKQLATGGKTLGQLLTPELIAAQNANKLFNDGLVSSVDEVDLLTASINRLTESLSQLVSTMNVGAGVNDLTSAVGAVATAETRIYEQMSIPGFATGGIISGPGTGTSDSIVARVSSGESILTAAQTKKFYPLIQAIMNDNVPGFADGEIDFRRQNKRGQSYDTDLAHAGEMSLSAQNRLFSEHQGFSELNASGLGSVEILGKQVGIQGKGVNRNMGRGHGGVTAAEMLADMQQTGSMKFAEGAVNGGMPANRIKDPAMQKALVDLDVQVKKNVELWQKDNGDKKMFNKDYYDIIEKSKDQIRKESSAHAELVDSLNKSNDEYGGYRVLIKNAREKLSQVISKMGGTIDGTLVKLKGDAIGELKSKNMGAGNARENVEYINGELVGGKSVSGPSFNMYGPSKSNAAAINAARNEINNITQPLREYIQNQGMTIAQFFGQGFNSGLTEQIPELKAVVEKFGTSAPQELESILEIASPSRWGIRIGQMFGKGVQVGVQDAIPGLEAAGEEAGTALATSTEEVVASPTIGSKIKGLLTKEGGGMNLGGKMMASSAIMTMGPMLANLLPKGSNIQGMASETSTMAGMGMMFGPWGAAAGAALGVVVSGFGDLMKAEREHQATVKASFTESDAAIKMFGGTVTSTTVPIIHFAQQVESAGITSKKALTQIEQMSNAIGQLSSSDPMKKTADSIKGYGDNVKAVVGTLKQFAAAQVASGMDPKGVQNMVAAMLQYSGQTQFLGAALKEIIPATQNVATAQSTLISKLVSAEGATNAEYEANMLLGGSYKDLDAGSKNLADGLSTVAMGMFSTTADATVLTATVKNLNNTQVDAYTSGTLLAAKLKDMGQTDLANRLLEINGYVKNTGISFLLATAQADGFAASIDEIKYAASNPQALAELTDQATKFVAAFNAAALKSATDAAIASAKAIKAALGTDGTGTTNTATPTEKKIMDALTKRIDAEDKINTLMQKQNQAAKDALDYATQQTDVQNKIRQAMAGGDYLTANLLRQQMASNTDQYNMNVISNTNQQIIDTGKQMVADAQATIANNGRVSAADLKAMSQYQTVNTLGSYNLGTISTPAAVSYGSASQMGTSPAATPAINIVINGTDLTQSQLQAAAQNAVTNALTQAGIKRGMSVSTTKVGGG